MDGLTNKKKSGLFMSIKDTAEKLGIEQHVLRFWEKKFPQIKPLRRGGGRRYYKIEDVEIINNIKHLLYDERYTIEGVKKLLSSGDKSICIERLTTPPSPRRKNTSVMKEDNDFSMKLEKIIEELLETKETLRKTIDQSKENILL